MPPVDPQAAGVVADPPEVDGPAQAQGISATNMSDWQAVLAQDAEFLGRAIGVPGLDKAVRQRVRALLWQAWALLQPLAIEGETAEDAPPVAPAPEPDALLALVRALESLRRELGDDRGAGVRRLRHVLIRKPMPERPRRIAAATITEGTARQVDRHFSVRVAVDRRRLEWFEARCRDQDPTRVAKVRQPDDAAKNGQTVKKDARESLELLVKRGPSRFS